MYKNIISFFSFHFITQNVQTSKSEKESKTAEMHTWGGMVRIFCEITQPFSSLGRNLCDYSDAYTNSHVHISSHLLLTCCMWTHLLLICHPSTFHSISAEGTPASCLLQVIDAFHVTILFPVSNILRGYHPHNFHSISGKTSTSCLLQVTGVCSSVKLHFSMLPKQNYVACQRGSSTVKTQKKNQMGTTQECYVQS